MLVQLGITIRNDTVTLHDIAGHRHPATMLSVALLYRGNTSHHNAIPLLCQTVRCNTSARPNRTGHGLNLAERSITLLYLC